jgi:hypothetical protein
VSARRPPLSHAGRPPRGAPSRRALLGGGVAAGLLPLFRSAVARADTGLGPGIKRLVIVNTAQGTVLSETVPTGSETSFSLPFILEPLEPFRDRMTVITGLDNRAPNFNTVGNAHDGANLTLFTGRPFYVQDSALLTAAGPTLEQVVAERFAGLSPYNRLDFVVGGSAGEGFSTSERFFYGPYDPVQGYNDPFVAVARIFGDASLSPADAWALRARRSSVLDAVMGQFKEMNRHLDGAGRDRLQAHLQKVSELEARITAGLGECNAPTFSTPTGYDFSWDDDVSAPILNDILCTALSCGLTRVATVSFANSHDHSFEWLWGANGGPIVVPGEWDNWHAMVHADYQSGMEWVYRWYLSMFADLLTRMDAAQDEDGDNLLDTSLVLWMPEFSSGRHWTRNLPAVLAGGVGDRGGRWLDFMSGTVEDVEAMGGYLDATATTNQLFTSVLQLLGEADTSFGTVADDMPEGPLPGL